MAKAVFYMTYTATGRQEMTLPNDIDINDPDAVRDYILDHWDTVSLPPYPMYVPDSDRLDETHPIVVHESPLKRKKT